MTAQTTARYLRSNLVYLPARECARKQVRLVAFESLAPCARFGELERRIAAIADSCLPWWHKDCSSSLIPVVQPDMTSTNLAVSCKHIPAIAQCSYRRRSYACAWYAIQTCRTAWVVSLLFVNRHKYVTKTERFGRLVRCIVSTAKT